MGHGVAGMLFRAFAATIAVPLIWTLNRVPSVPGLEQKGGQAVIAGLYVTVLALLSPLVLVMGLRFLARPRQRAELINRQSQ